MKKILIAIRVQDWHKDGKEPRGGCMNIAHPFVPEIGRVGVIGE